jgi:4'-phosphopantetheinyl transferase
VQPATDALMFDMTIYIAKLSDFALEPMVCHLSVDERSRMQRFRKTADIQRYILAHFLKRYVLSEYLKIPLLDLSFTTNDYGKPFCEAKNAPYFNLSHSGNWVVLAVSEVSEVGVDIEFPRDIDIKGVMKKISSDEQFECYTSVEPSKITFLCTWTQKEAISKACGRGLGVGMPNIPCSGNIGNGSVYFLSDNYYFLSHFMPEEGVLSYASTVIEKPAIIRVNEGGGSVARLLYEPFCF